MRLSRWVGFVGVTVMVTVTALEGCGDDATPIDLCRAVPCTRATSPSATAAQQCTTQLSDAQCGTAFKAMKECQTHRATCTTSGSLDTSATNTTCRPEIDAYNACAKTLDAGPDGCKRRTCSQANANCGDVDDGCGGTLQCGTCSNGQTCGGGSPNRCGCQCDPTWCGTLTACNTTITCPTTCVAPQFCGGGGIANRCGCAPAGLVGPQSPAAVSTASIVLEAGSQTTWSGTSNARNSDNSVATATLGVGSTTQYIVALNYAFAIPTTATIAGITVQVERSASAGLATTDRAVHLVKGTQIQSSADNKAVVGAMWPISEETVSYGGATDSWGTTWTAADINSGGFGVAFAATYTGQTGLEQARIDSIRVTVHYSGVACP